MKSLYPYQSEYLARMPKDIIMAADVGLGKTLMALHHYKKHGEGRPLLVIAPASKVKTFDWHREIEDFFGLAQPEWYVISYDKFARRPDEYMKLKDLCVIADEVHYVCQSQSKRGKAVRAIMRQSDQFIGLSGTALPNGWSSLENYAIMFGLVKHKTEFLTQYVRIDRSRGFPLILGYNHEDRLKQFWGRISKPLERDGNLVLPQSSSIGVPIEMELKERRSYMDIVRNRIYENAPLESPSSVFSALRQVLTPSRENALISTLEGTSEHVVIFYNYDKERELILRVMAKHFPDRKVWEQSGHASDLPPRGIWDSMKPSVTLAQYQSASTAIELTYASVTIFLSPTYSYANFHQAKGRTSRNGQTKQTLFYLFSVAGTIDGQVWKALREKKNFNDNLWNGLDRS